MKYTTEIYEQYLEKIQKFEQLSWVQNYLHLQEKPNFWTILEYGERTKPNQKSSHEIRYSKMFRWLLDPNENHQMGHLFAQKLLNKLEIKYVPSTVLNPAVKVTTEALEDIDIFYHDEENHLCVAIELKQFTTEHESTNYRSQLDKYEDVVGNFIQASEQEIQPIYIYLTVLKEKPSNASWHAVGYEEIIRLLEEVRETLTTSSNRYKEDTMKIIGDFIDDLQRSIDLASLDKQEVKSLFSKKERQLTKELVHELNTEVESEHFKELLKRTTRDEHQLKEVLMMMEDFMQTQDHRPNESVQVLMRKMYNYLSQQQKVDTEEISLYKAKETTTALHREIITTYDLQFDTIELTAGRGQGIKLLHRDRTSQIYLSGDIHGSFPNDFVHLLPIPRKARERVNGVTLPNKLFNVNDYLIYEDQIRKRDGEVLTFDQLMKDYVLPAIQELNGRMEEL